MNKETVLKKQKLVLLSYMSEELIEDQIALQFMLEENAMRLVRDVWTQDLDEYHYKHPIDWWNAFKERWFPYWLKKIFPVEYSNYTVDIDAVYPELLLNIPHTRRIGVYKTDDDDDDDD